MSDNARKPLTPIELISVISSALTHRHVNAAAIPVSRPGTMGGTPKVGLASVELGIDWDSGVLLVNPEQELVTLKDAREGMFSHEFDSLRLRQLHDEINLYRTQLSEAHGVIASLMQSLSPDLEGEEAMSRRYYAIAQEEAYERRFKKGYLDRLDGHRVTNIVDLNVSMIRDSLEELETTGAPEGDTVAMSRKAITSLLITTQQRQELLERALPILKKAVEGEVVKRKANMWIDAFEEKYHQLKLYRVAGRSTAEEKEQVSEHPRLIELVERLAEDPQSLSASERHEVRDMVMETIEARDIR